MRFKGPRSKLQNRDRLAEQTIRTKRLPGAPAPPVDRVSTLLTGGQAPTTSPHNAAKDMARAIIRKPLVPILFLALLAWPAGSRPLKRDFHKVDLAAYASWEPDDRRIPTHIQLDGTIALRKTEADGDIHIRLADGEGFAVAECIPNLPDLSAACAKLAVGAHLWVRGIARYDDEHRWHEVHPVLDFSLDGRKWYTAP